MNPQLDQWLQEVSRSFYLSLKILPQELRDPLSLAYLWARDLDTIADEGSTLSLTQRRQLIDLRLALMNLVFDSTIFADQGDLPQRINELARQTAQLQAPVKSVLKKLFETLPKAMIFDLEHFAHKRRVDSLTQTESYTDWAAGCVGVAWTELCQVLISECKNQWNFELQKNRGQALGQFLQWVNILRDQGNDLKKGRCYLPEQYDGRWTPLVNSHVLPRAREGLDYVQEIPEAQASLTVAVSLPLSLGLKTLEGLKRQAGFKLNRLTVLASLAQLEFEARTDRSKLLKRLRAQIESSEL